MPVTEYISAPPFITSQIALNRQQPRLMVNGVMIAAPTKLSVALVTRFVIFVGVSQGPGNPRTHLG